MASIAKDPGGRRRILFVAPDRKRKTIRLGKVSQRTAESVKLRVEHLVAAAIHGHALDAETARWLADIPDELANKLARVGLVPKREQAVLGPYLRSYFEKRIDVKGDTKVVWGHTRRNLLAFFGDNKPLREITAGDAEDFRLYLPGEGLAATTIHKRLQVARQFFQAAVKRGLIPANPFPRCERPGWRCLRAVLLCEAGDC
jgi:hypothetical protein